MRARLVNGSTNEYKFQEKETLESEGGASTVVWIEVGRRTEQGVLAELQMCQQMIDNQQARKVELNKQKKAIEDEIARLAGL